MADTSPHPAATRADVLPGYAASAAYVALAFLARLASTPALDDRSPLLFFTLAILAAAAGHGVGPALFATAAGAVLGIWAFLGPSFAFAPLSADAWANVGAYLATSAGAIFIAERLRRSRNLAAAAEAAAEANARLLRHSEDRLRRVLDQLFAFVGITELDGKLVEANRAPLEAAGIRLEDVIGRPVWEAYWWSYDPNVQMRLRDAVSRAAAGETVRYDVPIRVAGGGLATIDFQIAPLRDPSGAITHLVPSAIPIEERVRAEAELRQRIAQLRSVYDGVPVGLAFHDRELRFVEVNDALSAINGMPASEHIGRLVTDVLPETATNIALLQRRVIETGESLVGLEVRARTPANGSERDYLVSYTPARDSTGEVTGLTVAVVDITDRKAAEAAVRRSEALLGAVLDALPVGVIIADGQGRIVRDNAANRELWGVPPETTSWEAYADWVGYWPDTGERIRANEWAMARALLRGETVRDELVQNERFGTRERRCFLNNAAPVRDGNGSIIGGVVAELDITERLAANTALRESEARFRTLAEAMPALVYTARERGNTYVNARYAEYTGLTIDELMGEGWRRILHPDDARALEGRGTASLVNDGPLEVELRLRRADGQWRWHLVRGMRHQIDPELVVGAMVDIHDRRLAEERLAVSEARYRTLFDSIDAGFCIAELKFDEAGRAIDYRLDELNPAFERQTGLIGAEGRWVRDIVPDLEGHWFDTYGRVAVTGEATRFEDHAEPFDRWFDVYAVPVGETAPYRVGILFNDVSERRRAEEEVRRLNRDLEALVAERTRRLEETVAELDAFAYTISHDLRAPLRGIEGFARILNEEHAAELGGRGQRYAQRIYAAAERMDELIQDLLAYSRLSRADIQLKRVNLEAVVDASLKDHEAVIEAAGAKLVIERPLPEVRGARAVLGQIVGNLLTNAIKFVEKGTLPEVRIHAELDNGFVRLWIEDNGIGIDEEFRDRIFNVFERLHGQEHYSGTGIGLAIVKKAAERLGGRAGVASKSGGGSRFWVDLPASVQGGAA